MLVPHVFTMFKGPLEELQEWVCCVLVLERKSFSVLQMSRLAFFVSGL